MKWVKAAGVGALGSFLMLLLMMIAIQGLHVTPFNVPPPAAMMIHLGLPPMPLGPLAHFGYGMFWSVVFVALFGGRADMAKALGLAGALWLFMMLAFSPVVGWGVFGFGGPGHLLPANAPLHLGPAPKYIAATLLAHLVYGLTLGWLDPAIARR